MMQQGQTTSEQIWDVIVIGAGPSGCGVAALLAQKGWKVLVLEKETFPRYHIGESLIPYCWFPLEKIGILDKIKAADFTSKQSVQFVSTEGIASKPFYFFEHTQHVCAQTWQVSRSDFDHLMLRHAEECGAVIKQSTTVLGLIQEQGFVQGVEAQSGSDQQCQYRGKMTIDASGRSMLSASRPTTKVLNVTQGLMQEQQQLLFYQVKVGSGTSHFKKTQSVLASLLSEVTCLMRPPMLKRFMSVRYNVSPGLQDALNQRRESLIVR